MCNYKYQKEDNLHGKPCIYPDFYKNYSDRFLLTKDLPIDKDGYCIFHSKDVEWKKENGFNEKFQELFSVLTEILKIENNHQPVYNFSGFYFSEPFSVTDYFLPNQFDFMFCEFLKPFSISKSDIKGWFDIRNAHFYDTFVIRKVNFKKNLYGTHASFDNGFAFYNCQFENYTIFEDCIFKKRKGSKNIGFTIQNDNEKKDNTTDFKKTADYISFKNSRFEVDVNFRDIIFNGDVAFDNCIFLDEFYFQQNIVNSTINFNESEFLLSHIINPIYGSVDFQKIAINTNGKLAFKGKEPLADMVKGEMYITFQQDPEGIVSFENFNLNKILPKNKTKLLDLKKTEKVIIGKGCGIYRFRTATNEILVLKHNQNLVEEFLKTYTRFLTINKSISLGVEIEIRTIDSLRFYYFTDDPNISEEVFNKIFEEQTVENLKELTSSKSTNNYEELESKLDVNHLFAKMALREVCNLWDDEDTKQLTKIDLSGKHNTIIVNIIKDNIIDMSKKTFKNNKIQNKGILSIGDNTVIKDNSIINYKGNRDELKNALIREGLEDKIKSLIDILESEPQDKKNKTFGPKLKTWLEGIGIGVSVEVVKAVLFHYLGWEPII